VIDSDTDDDTSLTMNESISPLISNTSLYVAKCSAVKVLEPSVLQAQHGNVSQPPSSDKTPIVRYRTRARRTTVSVNPDLVQAEDMDLPVSKYPLDLQKNDQLDSADEAAASILGRVAFSMQSVTAAEINAYWDQPIEARDSAIRALQLTPTGKALFEKRQKKRLAEQKIFEEPATYPNTERDTYRKLVDSDATERYFNDKRKVGATSDNTTVVTNEDKATGQTLHQPSQGYKGTPLYGPGPQTGRRYQIFDDKQEYSFTGSPKVKFLDLLDSTDFSNTSSWGLTRPKPTSSRMFHNFMDLPGELRELVYSFILVRGRIHPHLCTEGSGVKFRDDNERAEFGGIGKSLNITCVSRELRKESLPIFYKENIFAFGADTPVYFEYLDYLGRFQWIHRVDIPIQFYNEENGAKAMRDIQYYILEHEKYEKNYAQLPPASKYFQSRLLKQIYTPRTLNLEMLKKHPVYKAGGLPYIGIFFVLRKLSATHTSSASSADFERELVLRVPNAAIFTEYRLLHWFPKVAASLGIEVKFVNGANLNVTGGGFVIEWMQKYQKKDSTKNEPVKCQDYDKRIKRAIKQFPAIQALTSGSNYISYYRVNCETGTLNWTRVPRCSTLT
jgi:hypothetical protein